MPWSLKISQLVLPGYEDTNGGVAVVFAIGLVAAVADSHVALDVAVVFDMDDSCGTDPFDYHVVAPISFYHRLHVKYV